MAEESQTVPQEVKITIYLPACVDAGIDFVESVHAKLDTISELKETLASTSQLNQVTNYDLIYLGVRITEKFDDFSTLDEIFPEGATEVKVSMVEKPYNLKAVYEHLTRLRENIGLNFLDYAAKSFGVGVGCSTLNSLGLKDVKPSQPEAEEKSETAESENGGGSTDAEVVFSEEDVAALKKQAVKLLEDDDSSSATAVSVLDKWVLPIKSLTLSQWNPVPQQQKLKGDLLYLTLSTLENETFAITCHATGFFVSRISGANFDPTLKVNEKGVSHQNYLLFKLIASLSPKFSATLASNKSALYEASQFPESYLIPSQVVTRFPWSVAEQQIKQLIAPDYSRSQLPAFSTGTDGADLVKDWNEEFQGIKEFPRDSFQERLLRDKLLNKYIQEFNQTATATALEIVKGNLAPLNPNEEPKKHIYLRNNIFYSYGVNATGSHDSTGGDEAARYCFGKDLNSIKLMNRVDAGGACTLLSCVVDYLGERVVCQAPVPGIFTEQVDSDGNPFDKVSYGYFLEKDEIKLNDAMEEALKPMAEAFHLKPHSLTLATGAATPEDGKLVVSKDTKGIKGTDGRNYIMDLYRTTPLDINFLEAHYDANSETSYPHKEASIRHEAVEEWYKRKAAALFKLKTEELEKEGSSEMKEGDEKPQIAIPYDEIVFNPDAFVGVNDSEEDRETVREICTLVTKYLIQECMEDVSKTSVPIDGVQLTDFLHKKGINMRYLGELAKKADEISAEFKANVENEIQANEKKIEEYKDQSTGDKAGDENKAVEKDDEKKPTAAKLHPVVAAMATFRRLTVQEMIVRGVKHVLRKESQQVPYLLKPYFIAHIHNCLLGSKVEPSPEVQINSEIKALFLKDELDFTNLDSKKVKQLVEREVYSRFRFKLPETWIVDLNSSCVLREIALKFGIQWKAQQYYFEKEAFDAAYKQADIFQEVAVKGKKKKTNALASTQVVRKTTFTMDDIVSLVPVVKDSSYRCSLVDEVFETARQQILLGDKQVGLDLCSEFISFYQQIYGGVHVETADAYASLAQLYADSGMVSEACILSRKSIILNERLRGVDSYETINLYIQSSIYEAVNKNPLNSFLLSGKAFKTWSTIFGKDHPNTLNTLSNIASILDSAGLFDVAEKFYEEALNVSVLTNGELSDITAVLKFRYAGHFYQTGQLETALEQFASAAKLFAKVVGPEDTLTKECFTFVVSIKRYLDYTQLEKEKAKTAAKRVKVNSASKNVAASKPETTKRGKKAKAPVAVDPSIASKSVDEILQYIEGNSTSKKSKSKH